MRLWLFLLPLSLKLVFQVLHVVVSVVLNHRLWWQTLGPLILLPVELKIAAVITSRAAPKYTTVLRFLCRTPLGSGPARRSSGSGSVLALKLSPGIAVIPSWSVRIPYASCPIRHTRYP